ncbi:hypothetical protein BGZ63DRAFT_358641 [Mariannaea sp. PMI_226]|nr:hypothetical protein BGZ63DRAFT_358641 [Mariannaea sp. PMI_226]
MPSATSVQSFTPPKVVGPATKKATRPTNILPRSLIDDAKVETKEAFNPEKHLNYEPPSKIYTMKELGFEGHGISPNAVSEPFPLFTQDAIKQMRSEIFTEEAYEHCQYASTFNKNMIRGLGPARAPFIYDVWHSPEVIAKVSEVAGIEVVPSFDFEIANINISINNGKVEATQSDLDPLGDGLSTVAWHYDSFPFVCVTMLSDCTDMVGGETALRTASGEIKKVRGPAMGTAVILQGRYIEHQALKALGGRERISMVTCFRPKSPLVKDETVLVGVRGISNRSELYTQYTDYRLEILEERIRDQLKKERRRELSKKPFELDQVRNFLTEQKIFIESMLEELIE